MPKPDIRSIDDYDSYLQAALSDLRPEQRTAFTAAMAERYLPVYAAFAKAEDWGDPASMRSSLDAVWDHLRGQALTARDIDRHNGLVRDSTPHMDDFDPEEALDNAALAAAVLVGEALACCRRADNLAPAVQAAMSGFEAVLPGWSDDPEDQPRLWQKSAVRKEFSQQIWLLERVSAVERFDDDAVQALRREVVKPEHAGKIPKRKAPSGPPQVTNQVLFEQYRRMVEADLKSSGRSWGDLEMTPQLKAIQHFSQWAGRYSRRKNTIDGSYGLPADSAAQAALVARNQAIDRALIGTPDWDSTLNEWFGMMLRNQSGQTDAAALDEPHGYGPSLRRLWIEARNRGFAGEKAWEQITAWAYHRPAAWALEDQRKKKGLAHTAPGLVQALARRVEWTRARDSHMPWSTEMDGQRWQVRLNDFPDEPMYSLLVDGAEQGSFHDWPETWKRE